MPAPAGGVPVPAPPPCRPRRRDLGPAGRLSAGGRGAVSRPELRAGPMDEAAGRWWAARSPPGPASSGRPTWLGAGVGRGSTRRGAPRATSASHLMPGPGGPPAAGCFIHGPGPKLRPADGAPPPGGQPAKRGAPHRRMESDGEHMKNIAYFRHKDLNTAK